MTLLNFIDALAAAMAKLQWICAALARKAKGEAYSKAAYQQDMAEYNGLVSAYQEVGGRLNAAMALSKA